MFVSPRMSLKVWTSSTDPYDHEQLADNFLKLDQHDHSQGRGALIGGDGIQQGAITSYHIYPGTIDNTISDNEVTDPKLAPGARVPVGTVLDWYCATPIDWASILPSNYKVCDGSAVAADDHAIPGVGGTFTLPDLRNKFILGADPTKGLGSDQGTAINATAGAPSVMGAGGSQNRDLRHTHSVPTHYHGKGDLVLANTTLSLSDPGHTHALVGDVFGAGGFLMDSGHGNPGATYGYTSTIADGGSLSVNRSNLYAASSTTGIVLNNGNHTHTLNGTYVGNNGGVNGDSAMTSGQASVDYTAQDTRPQYVGLLKIMKVK